MKKILLLGLAVLIAGTCNAAAKNTSISFDGLCDGFDIQVTKGLPALETGNGCDKGANYGAGTVGSVKGKGKAITFGVNLSGKGDTKDQYIYVVSYPLVTGGTWYNFFTSDGKTLSRIGGGTYTVSGPVHHDTHGLRSSTDRSH